MFVGNLSFQTTEQELETLFREVGEVVKVTVPTDRATGSPRGFAFVELASSESVTEAISKFDGFELGGRRLRVNEAQEQAGGGGGGRSFSSPDRPARRPTRPGGSRRNIRSRKRSV